MIERELLNTPTTYSRVEENTMSDYYEIRWINPAFDEEIVEKFGEVEEAQERVREIRKEHGFAPNIWTRKSKGGI